jgi:hypothetical protein
VTADSFSRFFWPRALALQLLLLGLWWCVLYQPSLAMLHLAAEIPFGLLPAKPDESPLEVDATGEWKFTIPVGAIVRDSTQSNAPVSVHAIDFSAPPENVAPFTTAWFVYMGLALNAPFNRANVRRTIIGLAIQTAVSGLALLCYAEINARDRCQYAPLTWRLISMAAKAWVSYRLPGDSLRQPFSCSAWDTSWVVGLPDERRVVGRAHPRNRVEAREPGEEGRVKAQNPYQGH